MYVRNSWTYTMMTSWLKVECPRLHVLDPMTYDRELNLLAYDFVHNLQITMSICKIFLHGEPSPFFLKSKILQYGFLV